MTPTTERKARYKIAEERSFMNGNYIFWVYKKRNSLSLFGSPDWAPDKFFANLEDAEKYVREQIEYEDSSHTPKMVKYY